MQQPSAAQSCCGGTGAFVGGIERGNLQVGTFIAGVVYSYTAMERTLAGSRPVPNPNGSIAATHAINLEVELAPSDRWSILVVLPFTDKFRTVSVSTGTTTLSQRYHAAGISDVFGLAKYTILPSSPLVPWNVAIGAGVKAPTGSYRVSANGVELPLDVQPGTSSWDGIAWALVSYRVPSPGMQATLSTLLRQPGENINGRQMGTDLQALLTVTVTEWDTPFIPVLLSRCRWTASDRQNDRIIAATGTFRLELLPSVAVMLGQEWVGRLGLQLPVYERTNGVQLVPSWGVFAELRASMRVWE
ncbi:MAG: hypothetical protein RML15_05625 [Bacteroidota bacterium]|nr:hypothetical protein [Candidatus Kapabacteria bacterium]MCX7937179.1 hypothetical protein [Chlorobiota bacterium]MDW8075256.1 hypothetical protein [Bacteroidota bacterium]MDW8271869.1 hypothetical protein [Bacteroidota bacterium]